MGYFLKTHPNKTTLDKLVQFASCLYAESVQEEDVVVDVDLQDELITVTGSSEKQFTFWYLFYVSGS